MSAYFACLFLFVSNSPAVDTVRQSLEADSSRWFGWLVKASILVGIGVVLEEPEATVALKRWYRLWRGKEVEAENEKSLLIPIAYLGLLLVVVGVAGEGIFEFLSSHSETALRGHDEQILAETESKFGQVKDSAEAAAKAAGQAEASASTADASAREASSKSGEAVTSAGNAIALAKDARQQADSFEKDIASANKTATEAEKHLAEALREATQAEAELNRIRSPRSITDEPTFVSALTPFKGTEYTLNAFMDDESAQFTKVVARALDAAGWVRKQPTSINLGIPTLSILLDKGNENVPSCIDTGISIHAFTNESLAVLQSLQFPSLPKTVQAALMLKDTIAPHIFPPEERNVGQGVVDPKPADGVPMTICVGKKP